MVMSSTKTELLGQYLLQGWIMMADHCQSPSCLMPLMKNGRTNEIVCASCGPLKAQKQSQPVEEHVEEEDFNSVQELDIEDIPEDFEDFVVQEPPTRDITSILGEYLLKGWVMMNECCPECNVPLMRTKDSSIIKCFQCNQDVVKEGNVKKVDPKPAAVVETPKVEIKVKKSQQTSEISSDFVDNMNRYLIVTSQRLLESNDLKEQDMMLALILKAQNTMKDIKI